MKHHSPRYAAILGIAISLPLSFVGCKSAKQPAELPGQPASPSASMQTPMAPGAAPMAPAQAATATPMASDQQAPAGSEAPIAPAAAVAVAPAPPPPPPPPRILPAGTSFSTRLSTSLSSKTSTSGQSFTGTLASSVRLNGSTVIPAGSSVEGVVTEAHSAGKFKGSATLSVMLISVTVRGRSYSIASNTISVETKGKGKRTGAMVGGGAGGGALIGGLAGGGKGALIGGLIGAGAGTAGAAMTGNNRDIDYPAETLLAFHISKRLDLGPSS
jgi:hypothetical protein